MTKILLLNKKKTNETLNRMSSSKFSSDINSQIDAQPYPQVIYKEFEEKILSEINEDDREDFKRTWGRIFPVLFKTLSIAITTSGKHTETVGKIITSGLDDLNNEIANVQTGVIGKKPKTTPPPDFKGEAMVELNSQNGGER